MKIKKLKKNIKHQDIGGKDFIIDDKISETLTNSDVFNKGMLEGNWACYNFIQRRPDFKFDFSYKLYYGKVNGLGYIVAEDEFEEV